MFCFVDLILDIRKINYKILSKKLILKNKKYNGKNKFNCFFNW